MNFLAGSLLDTELERNQSKRALAESVRCGFFLRKKPLSGIASRYSYSDFAIAERTAGAVYSGCSGTRVDVPRNRRTQVDATIREWRPCTKLNRTQ